MLKKCIRFVLKCGEVPYDCVLPGTHLPKASNSHPCSAYPLCRLLRTLATTCAPRPDFASSSSWATRFVPTSTRTTFGRAASVAHTSRTTPILCPRYVVCGCANVVRARANRASLLTFVVFAAAISWTTRSWLPFRSCVSWWRCEYVALSAFAICY